MIRTLSLPLAALLAAPAVGQIAYVDDTQNAGLIAVHEAAPYHPSVMMVGGGTIGDFNRDGWPDVFMPSGGTRPDYLFINDGDGTFTESSQAWGLTDLHMGVGSAVGDFDNDGWQDLYVCSFGKPGQVEKGHNKLYRNNGDGTFTDVAVQAGVNQPSAGNNCFGAAWGDYDEDGDLDLFVTAYAFGQYGNTLHRNNGDGTFTDVSAAVGLPDLSTTRGFVPSFTDLNQDGHPDIILIADTGTSKYFQNNGDGTFFKGNSMIPDLHLPNGMGLATGDFDLDGDLDFYVSDIYHISSNSGGNRLYVNDGTGSYWAERAKGARIEKAGWAWGVAATDIDNDGWLDFASTNGWFGAWENYPTRIFHNQHDGYFGEIAAACGVAHYGQGRSLLRFDADRDGDEDLLITESNGPLSYFRNETYNDNHWLRVRFDTSAHAGLAPDGFGTEVIARSGKRSLYRQLDSNQSFLGQSELVLHLGLGMIDKLDELEIRWADGQKTIYQNVAVDRELLVRASQPVLAVSPAQPHSPATVTLDGFVPDAVAVLGSSTVGAGPTPSPYGDLALSEPIRYDPVQIDGEGHAAVVQYVPGWMSGRTVWLQALDLESRTLSNPLEILIP